MDSMHLIAIIRYFEFMQYEIENKQYDYRDENGNLHHVIDYANVSSRLEKFYEFLNELYEDMVVK